MEGGPEIQTVTAGVCSVILSIDALLWTMKLLAFM